eukprot:CAMPEP_0176209132 /NCGR_PEP_ID=MMETSP0121_2-20121125/13478_1 /TAXON_ID=160619 /ORGANISM="Kryptoperidinium foliaceum, Strain CCMP 1326" /LENGTH=341 /DNA_ID=CAMNT_0017548139 /DNA_START=419 /DNA_END=1441 /DNA_ORIENTATION=+
MTKRCAVPRLVDSAAPWHGARPSMAAGAGALPIRRQVGTLGAAWHKRSVGMVHINKTTFNLKVWLSASPSLACSHRRAVRASRPTHQASTMSAQPPTVHPFSQWPSTAHLQCGYSSCKSSTLKRTGRRAANCVGFWAAAVSPASLLSVAASTAPRSKALPPKGLAHELSPSEYWLNVPAVSAEASAKPLLSGSITDTLSGPVVISAGTSFNPSSRPACELSKSISSRSTPYSVDAHWLSPLPRSWSCNLPRIPRKSSQQSRTSVAWSFCQPSVSEPKGADMKGRKDRWMDAKASQHCLLGLLQAAARSGPMGTSPKPATSLANTSTAADAIAEIRTVGSNV